MFSQRAWFEQPNAQNNGFETTALGVLKLIHAREGHVEFTLRVEQRHLNAHGTLHGG
jgi:acyl-coenzyme A thioesterase PaaI-like protein